MSVTKNEHLILRLQPLAFGSFINWTKLILENETVELKYLPRALYVSIASFLGIPFRAYERALFNQKIKTTEIKEPPIFIVGHWRSGTTHLHNLMSLDKNLGYVSTSQSWAPELFLANRNLLDFILKRVFPETRPMDNVKLLPKSPMEDEFSLGNMSPFCFYHGWYFPKKIESYFRKFILLEEIDETIHTKWEKTYLEILKKATFNMKGKRLIVKNPCNTGRIEFLLKLFPDAKFIHIYRNPYDVYLSTKNLYSQLLPVFILQDFDKKRIEECIFGFYIKMMNKFWQTKHLIPSSNLIEIRYEHLESQPIKTLENIYNTLNISGFEENKVFFENYLESLGNYQKNEYLWEEKMIDKIYKNWKFFIEEWQYSSPLVKN